MGCAIITCPFGSSSQAPAAAPSIAIGCHVFLHDPSYPIPRFQTCEFAQLRHFLSQLCDSEEEEPWATVHGVYVQATGRDALPEAVHIKKSAGAGNNMLDAGFRIRVGDNRSASGCSLQTFIHRLGTVPASELGIQRLVVESVADNGDVVACHRNEGDDEEDEEEDGEEDDKVDLAIRVHLEAADQDMGTERSWGLKERPDDACTHTDEEQDESEEGEQAAGEVAEEADADALAVAPLYSVSLKLLASVYVLADGRANVSIARDDLLQPLTGLGVGNPGNAMRPARIATYDPVYCTHNGGRNRDARISMTPRGLRMITNMYTEAEGELNQSSLDAMIGAINRLCRPATPPPPPPKKRPRRGSPDAHFEEAEKEAEVEVEAVVEEEEGEEEASALELRLEALLDKFDDAIDNDAVAEEFGRASTAFVKQHRCAPTNEESRALLRDARAALVARVTLGQGHVRREEVSSLLLKAREAARLPGAVAALEKRAA